MRHDDVLDFFERPDGNTRDKKMGKQLVRIRDNFHIRTIFLLKILIRVYE